MPPEDYVFTDRVDKDSYQEWREYLRREHLRDAAPDLLEALEDVIGDLELFVSRQGPGPDKRLARCKAAIAKAKGH